ncbi:MAG TPA: hypothetical protein VEQ42_08045 [Pyrinomonadaceae bacterium]|nr:hypothetical protein [Pyrinomonadaceae bacterium]
MQTGNNATAQFPSTTGADSRVEVILETSGGEEMVALRYSTWVEGLGWCTQKTFSVDAAQLEDLQRSLTAARHRINRRRTDAGQAHAPAQVLQFPALG